MTEVANVALVSIGAVFLAHYTRDRRWPKNNLGIGLVVAAWGAIALGVAGVLGNGAVELAGKIALGFGLMLWLEQSDRRFR